MSFTLLTELLLAETTNWKREALHFQQLMLDNPWVKNLDVNIEIDADNDVLVHVQHPLVCFTLNASNEFSLNSRSAEERYGKTAQEVYNDAMPMLIGLHAAEELTEMSTGFKRYSLGTTGDEEAVINLTHESGQTATFHWNVAHQAFEPVDEDNLPPNHGFYFDTIDSMNNYLDSFDDGR